MCDNETEESTIWDIYKITNTANGKLYIGKTECSDPTKRWNEHKRDYKKKRNEKRPLYDAMNKYGIDTFCFEVIDSEDDSEKLCEKERYYIREYRTYVGFPDCNGYNATLGGDGKSYLKYSDQEVIDIYEKCGYVTLTAKELEIDPHTVQEILKRNNIQYFTGQTARDYCYYANHYGVSKINIETRKIIDNYRSVNEIILENPLFNRKKIYGALDGENHHERYGFLWYRMIDLPDWVKR